MQGKLHLSFSEFTGR